MKRSPPAVIAAILLLCSSVAFGQGYSDDMYRRALENQSTAPLYVLVSIRDEGAVERETCLLASLLLGAIHREHGLGYDEGGRRRAFDSAIAQPGRVFSFSEQVRAGLPPAYGADELAVIRQRVASMTNVELRAALSDRRSALRAISAQPIYRDALAHVLLERGILVGSADLTGELYVTDMATGEP